MAEPRIWKIIAMKKSLEIQGLRALAVSLVIIYHIWPQYLPGGFIGVDVFFVISGYLITRIMLEEVEKTGKFDTLNFYSRRIRRLLPASSFVILIVLLGYSLFPAIQWESIFDQSISSIFYYQNWFLGFQAIDYLNSELPASPLQHYWSLTVEEQYYFIWPVLIYISLLLTRRTSHRTRSLFKGLVLLIIVTSLAFSVYETQHNPAMAYYSTFTRMWELAAGGLLAVTTLWRNLSHSIRAPLGWLGLSLIGLSAFVINKETPFPSYWALLPVTGTMLLIMADSLNGRFSTSTILNWKGSQFIGDISYSLYLWHWPLIIFYTSNLGEEVSFAHGSLIVITAIAFAYFSYEMIEKGAFQGNRNARGYKTKSLSIFIALTGLCLALVYIAKQNLILDSSKTQTTKNSTQLFSAQNVLKLKDDKPEAYFSRCYGRSATIAPRTCQYGDTTSNKKVMLMGDSHSMHWAPALREIADEKRWNLTLLAKTACAIGDEKVADKDAYYEACYIWNSQLLDFIDQHKPSLILFSQSRKHKVWGEELTKAENKQRLASALSRFWKLLQQRGITVMAIRDTPWLGDTPVCLSRNLEQPALCDKPRNDVLGEGMEEDPLVIAAAMTDNVKLIDLSGEFCDESTCFATQGNQIVWRDGHHMSATFARTLANELKKEIGDVDQSEHLITESVSTFKNKELFLQALEDFVELDNCSTMDEIRVCSNNGFQRTDSEKGTVVLLGDSRITQWATLFSFQNESVVSIDLRCPIVNENVKIAGRSKSCFKRTQAAINHLKTLKVNKVYISQSLGYKIGDFKDWDSNAMHLASNLASFVSEHLAGTEVSFVADTPRRQIEPNKCIVNSDGNKSLCAELLSALGINQDPLELAAKKLRINYINFNNIICPDKVCHSGEQYPIWRSKYLVTDSFIKNNLNDLGAKIK